MAKRAQCERIESRGFLEQHLNAVVVVVMMMVVVVVVATQASGETRQRFGAAISE